MLYFVNKYKNKYKLEVAVKWLEIEVGMDVLLLLVMFIIGVYARPLVRVYLKV